MKKKPDPSLIRNELETGSAFFSGGGRQNTEHTAAPISPVQPAKAGASAMNSTEEPTLPSNDTEHTPSTKLTSDNAPISDYPSNETIELIRKAVKQVGREGQVFRLSLEEKRMLADIVYGYKRDGIRTSENEVCRIAIVFLLNDYKGKGDRSILSRVIDALIS